MTPDPELYRTRPSRAHSTRRVRVGHASPGFTLLELLVVIAIIAVLAAILFPVFTLVRRKAYTTTCASNMHQLARAMTMYADDNDNHFPRWWFEDSETTWDTAIGPLVKSGKVFECPANVARLQVPPGAIIRSYAFPRNVSGLGITTIRRPSDTVLLMEKGAQLLGDWNDSTAEFFQQMLADDYDGSGDAPVETYPHGRGKNFAYSDGHVGWSNFNTGPFAYQFINPDTKSAWLAGYCGNWHDPRGQITNRNDPGANLPQ